MTVVDVHTHYAPRGLLNSVPRDGGFLVTEGGLRLPVHYPDLLDPAAKLALLDERGIDAAVVSLTPHLFVYDGDAVPIAQRANDELAAYTVGPRLAALATLPIGHPAAAAEELARCVTDLGFAGAQIGTSLPDGRPLDRAGLEPLWEAAEGLAVPLVLHPYYAGPLQDPELFLNNSIGVPLDTCVAAARLICSGLLDRWTRLKLVLVHGGGHLVFGIGRLDNAHAAGRDAAAHVPSDYLDRFWFDSVVHAPRALRFLADVVGEERVLLGTDLPYVTAEQRPVEHARAAGLEPDALGANAVALFGLRPSPRDLAAPALAGSAGSRPSAPAPSAVGSSPAR